MFKKSSNPASADRAYSIFKSDVLIEGNIQSTEDMRIDGTINGNIECHGKIILGKEASVTGNIDCELIEISGSLQGNVCNCDLLKVSSSASLEGDIKTKSLEVEAGAKLKGMCMTIKDTSIDMNISDQ